MHITDINNLRDLKLFALSERKGICWETIAFAGFVLAAIIITTYLAFVGLIPLWLGAIFNSFWMLQGYTTAHECVHKNVHGGSKRFRWLNSVIGRIEFMCPLHSYAMHEHVHHIHHRHTNDPKRDVDFYVAKTPNLFIAIARSYIFYFYATYHAFKTAHMHPHPKRYVTQAVIELAIPYSIAITLCVMGYRAEVFFLWVIPAINTFAGVVFFFGWAPHRILENGNQLTTTRIFAAPHTIKGRLFTWLYNFHNYHLIHHLFPFAPWNSLERIYDRGKHVLEREGALISRI